MVRPTGCSSQRPRAAVPLVLCGWMAVAGCFAVVEPRFPESVAAALAERPMRRLEGQHLRLYYPEGRQQEAGRFLNRVEGCVRELRQRQHVHNAIADRKMTVVLPEEPFNNAFVAPRLLGYETTSVVPTFSTADVFSLEFGLPPDPGIIGCHEITHYVHAEQIAGFAWGLNTLFGASYTPQMGLDSWFAEGLAVYYETKLIPGVGRLAWPFWRGAFAAGYAGRRINGGDLHTLQRDFHGGNAYLAGSQFVRFLADRYGEDKLWLLIHKQARSILFPLGVNVRFWQAYDKSLSTLIDEFADEVQAQMPPRHRPVGQRVIRDAGMNARYARARDGSEALIVAGHDSPARLMVYAPDGGLRASRNLTDVVPPRDLAIASPVLVSGLSFTGDGRALYFVAIDRGPVHQVARLVRYDVASDTLDVIARDLAGVGGSVSPDGTRYAYARVDGDHHDLAELDIRTGAWRVLAVEPHGAFVSQPRYSPDGKSVLASEFDGARFQIVVFDATTGRRTGVLATGNQIVHDPSWIDGHRVVYLGAEPRDAGFQVYTYDLTTGTATRVTEAPYLAFQPRADAQGVVRFLNREGWGWTLDEVALPPPVRSDPVPASAIAVANAVAPRSVLDPMTATQSAEDLPASAIDGLFIPRLHGLTVHTIGRRDLGLGLVLSGNDRLEKHRWAIRGTYQFEGGGEPSVFAGYTNRTLAPLTITATVADSRIHDAEPTIDGSAPPAEAPLVLYRHDREANLTLSRSFWGNPVELGGSFMETFRPDDPTVLRDRNRFAGPHLSVAYRGAEATPYTGVRRLFAASASVGLYPSNWTTVGFDFADVRGEVATVVPLPASARHTLYVRLRGRAMLGSSQADGLLTVGGYQAWLLDRHSDQPETPNYAPAALPPGIVFSEAMAGFEDHPFATDRIVIAGAFYQYPLIVDWGTASTLGILPALFVRQLDLGLFGDVATDGRSGHRHAAAGGSLSLLWALWEAPLFLKYQVARRLSDDRAWVHLVTLGT